MSELEAALETKELEAEALRSRLPVDAAWQQPGADGAATVFLAKREAVWATGSLRPRKVTYP